jgi:hypothetical protein
LGHGNVNDPAASTYGSVTRTTNQSIPANAWTAIVFGTSIGENITVASTNKPFTVTKTGVYRVMATVLHDDNGIVSGSFMESRLTRNGAAAGIPMGVDGGIGARVTTSHSSILALTVGEIIGLDVRHSSSNNNTAVAELNIELV